MTVGPIIPSRLVADGPDPWAVKAGLAGRILRNISRFMRDLGYSNVPELRLPNGRRADLICLSSSAEIAIIEIKSSLEDFRADRKWRDYLPYCNRFYFAIPWTMDSAVLPADMGLIVVDEYDAFVQRDCPIRQISSATRRAILVKFGKSAADRLHEVSKLR